MVARVDALGWTVLHSLWQGGLIALLLWGALRVLRRTRPRVRYVCGVVALTAVLVVPVLTYRQTIRLWTDHRAWLLETADVILRRDLAERGRADVAEVRAELRRRHAEAWPGGSGPLADRAVEAGGAVAAGVGWLWVLGALVLLGRLGVQVRRASSLAATGEPDARWREATRQVSERLGVNRRVRVRVTSRVDVPALIGWRWPVILVPPAARSLPDDVVEAILAHELAHVRRHDYLVNLAQAVAETLLFYHPAAWWISAQIREERECSCDQSAIGVVPGGPARYLNALLTLEDARPAALATLALTGGPLVRRIRRIHERARGGPSVDRTGALLLIAIAALAGVVVPAGRTTVAARVSAKSLALRDLDHLALGAGAAGAPERAIPVRRAPCAAAPARGA